MLKMQKQITTPTIKQKNSHKKHRGISNLLYITLINK